MRLAPDDKTQERHFDWSGVVPTDLGGMELLEHSARSLCHALVAPVAALTMIQCGRLRVPATRGIQSRTELVFVAVVDFVRIDMHQHLARGCGDQLHQCGLSLRLRPTD